MLYMSYYALAVASSTALVLWVEDRLSPFSGNALDQGLLALEEWWNRQLDRRWAASVADAQE